MTCKIKGCCFLALFSIFLLTSVQAQTMYSWTDENGVVHFSDVEPTGQQAQEQVIPADDRPSSPDPYSSSSETASSYADQRRQQIAASSQAAQKEKAQNSVLCASWQGELSRLEPNRRVFSTNSQGEVERMDDVQRTDRVAALKNQIAQNCR